MCFITLHTHTHNIHFISLQSTSVQLGRPASSHSTTYTTLALNLHNTIQYNSISSVPPTPTVDQGRNTVSSVCSSVLELSSKYKKNISHSALCYISPGFRDRAFSVASPRAWNRLPMELRHLHSTPLFKCKLFTALTLHPACNKISAAILGGFLGEWPSPINHCTG